VVRLLFAVRAMAEARAAELDPPSRPN